MSPPGMRAPEKDKTFQGAHFTHTLNSMASLGLGCDFPQSEVGARTSRTEVTGVLGESGSPYGVLGTALGVSSPLTL